MRLAISKFSVLFLLSVTSLIGAAGCSTSKTSMPKAPSQAITHVADVSHDPSWTPPGELDFSIAETERTSIPTTVSAEALPRPNRGEIPRGRIHAATY